VKNISKEIKIIAGNRHYVTATDQGWEEEAMGERGGRGCAALGLLILG